MRSEERLDQRDLGGEMVEQPPFAQPRLFRHSIERKRLQPIAPENGVTGAKNKRACFAGPAT